MARVAPLLTLLLLLQSTPMLRAADDDAKAVILRAIKAHGGEEALTKYKAGTAKSKGTITVPGAGDLPFTQEMAYMLPDKLKETLQLSVGGNTVGIVTLINGEKCAIEANGTEVEITEPIKEALKDARQTLKVGRLVALVKDKGFELAPLGEAKVEGKPVVGVRVSAKGHKDVNLYFDKGTGRLAKLEHRVLDPMSGQELNEERIILEYGEKSAEGIPLPKKVLIKRDGAKFMEVEVQEAKVLEKIDDSEFKK